MSKVNQYYFVSLFSILIFILIGFGEQVQSQEKYPTRAIDVIVAFGPGGGIDLNTRVTTAYLNKKWGIPVNVVNKPGGRNVPATLELYKASPDGYTMFGDCNVTSSLMGATMKDLPFEVMDRTFIAAVSAVPYVVSVPSTSPIKNIKEFIEEAKKNPENITFTAGEVGIEFLVKRFFKTMGIDISKMKPVMIRDAAQAITFLAGGHVGFGGSMVSSGLPAIKAGTIRPLIMGFKSRHPDLPDVPTSQELGYPPFIHVGWIGISGPPKLPSYIVDIWSKALEEMIKDPAVISQFKKIGSEPFYNDPKATKEYVIKEMEEAKRILAK